mmetsp:Transcript_629/g.1475  ORF Transcript_629/g.1475 Transcript_629/m.1475 type:complete len:87 (+) Transcript_629:405-665(+)
MPSGRDEGQQHNQGLPSLICCPITGNIMTDPVVAADGHTYERSAIEHVFAQSPGSGEVLSPVTKKALAHRHLVPNAAVQEMASRYT